MKLTFLGTRSSVAMSTPRHRLHSSLLVEAGGVRLMVDCGSDWSGRAADLAPDALILTHAHEDHAGGLTMPSPFPVYAAEATWEVLKSRGVPQDRAINRDSSLFFGELEVRSFPIDHSLRAPACGLRLSHGGSCCIYLPDVAALPRPRDIMRHADLYIGDGSSFTSRLERMEAGVRCGHAAIPRQLIWAVQNRVGRILFTHCGEDILVDELRAGRMLRGLAGKYGIKAGFARDGMTVETGAGARE